MSLFKRKKKNIKPQDGAIYAVIDGNYKGQFIIFVEDKQDTYGVIAFPEMYLYDIPKSDVEDGFNKGIIDYVEALPKDVYSMCCAEYNHRKKLHQLKREAKKDEQEEGEKDELDS